MPNDMAGRLIDLAERLPERPEIAEELRALALQHTAQRRSAGYARAACQASETREVRAAALQCAVDARQRNPAISQAVIAVLIKLDFGKLVPAEERLRKWVRGWERAGAIPRANPNLGVSGARALCGRGSGEASAGPPEQEPTS